MLHIVPTPLGNLDDLSPRAVAALKESRVIFCEDTRRTARLCAHFGITARLERYNEHDEKSVSRAMERLRAGDVCSVVSDGGTPCVSDPGWKLVARARSEGVAVDSIPGPCAAITAFAASGMPVGGFVFLGFLPRKPSKIEQSISAAFTLGKPVIIYESPYRLLKFLRFAAEKFGAGLDVFVARELTKLHEECFRGTLEGALAHFGKRDRILGEVCVILLPPKADGDEAREEEEVPGEGHDSEDY